MRCARTIDKKCSAVIKARCSAVWTGPEDRACNTNDRQTFAYFTGSRAQLSQQVPLPPPGGNCAWLVG